MALRLMGIKHYSDQHQHRFRFYYGLERRVLDAIFLCIGFAERQLRSL